MLLFIAALAACTDLIYHFKTSYVTVYPKYTIQMRRRQRYFKTSYVTVYPNPHISLGGRPAFQNIVCYCLSQVAKTRQRKGVISKHRMLLFILTDAITTDCFLRFQNIVCYCLSKIQNKKRRDLYEFQNIVCYCLSGGSKRKTAKVLISKHRMLLFIEERQQNNNA